MAKKDPAKTQIRYEVIVQEDEKTGDILLPIPEEVLRSLDLKEGDDVEFEMDNDGTLYIKKAYK